MPMIIVRFWKNNSELPHASIQIDSPECYFSWDFNQPFTPGRSLAADVRDYGTSDYQYSLLVPHDSITLQEINALFLPPAPDEAKATMATIPATTVPAAAAANKTETKTALTPAVPTTNKKMDRDAVEKLLAFLKEKVVCATSIFPPPAASHPPINITHYEAFLFLREIFLLCDRCSLQEEFTDAIVILSNTWQDKFNAGDADLLEKLTAALRHYGIQAVRVVGNNSLIPEDKQALIKQNQLYALDAYTPSAVNRHKSAPKTPIINEAHFVHLLTNGKLFKGKKKIVYIGSRLTPTFKSGKLNLGGSGGFFTRDLVRALKKQNIHTIACALEFRTYRKNPKELTYLQQMLQQHLLEVDSIHFLNTADLEDFNQLVKESKDAKLTIAAENLLSAKTAIRSEQANLPPDWKRPPTCFFASGIHTVTPLPSSYIENFSPSPSNTVTLVSGTPTTPAVALREGASAATSSRSTTLASEIPAVSEAKIATSSSSATSSTSSLPAGAPAQPVTATAPLATTTPKKEASVATSSRPSRQDPLLKKLGNRPLNFLFLGLLRGKKGVRVIGKFSKKLAAKFPLTSLPAMESNAQVGDSKIEKKAVLPTPSSSAVVREGQIFVIGQCPSIYEMREILELIPAIFTLPSKDINRTLYRELNHELCMILSKHHDLGSARNLLLKRKDLKDQIEEPEDETSNQEELEAELKSIEQKIEKMPQFLQLLLGEEDGCEELLNSKKSLGDLKNYLPSAILNTLLQRVFDKLKARYSTNVQIDFNIPEERIHQRAMQCRYAIKIDDKGMANNSSSIASCLGLYLPTITDYGYLTDQMFKPGGRYADALIYPSQQLRKRYVSSKKVLPSTPAASATTTTSSSSSQQTTASPASPVITGDGICAVSLKEGDVKIVVPYTEAIDRFLDEYLDEAINTLTNPAQENYLKRLIALQCLQEERVFDARMIALRLVEQDFLPYLHPELLGTHEPIAMDDEKYAIMAAAAGKTKVFAAAAANNTLSDAKYALKPGTAAAAGKVGVFAPAAASTGAINEVAEIALIYEKYQQSSHFKKENIPFNQELENCRDYKQLKKLLKELETSKDREKQKLGQNMHNLIYSIGLGLRIEPSDSPKVVASRRR